VTLEDGDGREHLVEGDDQQQVGDEEGVDAPRATPPSSHMRMTRKMEATMGMGQRSRWPLPEEPESRWAGSMSQRRTTSQRVCAG